jgi:hypothetical protein
MIEISIGHEEKLATNSFDSFDSTQDRYRTPTETFGTSKECRIKKGGFLPPITVEGRLRGEMSRESFCQIRAEKGLNSAIFL